MRHNTSILAGLIFCAAMSFIPISCQKLAPELFLFPAEDSSEQQPPIVQAPDSAAVTPAHGALMLGITIPVDTTILTYIGQENTFDFTVTGVEGRSDINVTAEASGRYRQFELNLDRETGKGVLSFTLEDESASFTVLVNGPDTTFSRTIRTEAYYAVLSGIREGSVIDDDGRGGDIRIKIDSNIPDMEDVLSVVSDVGWINVSYDTEGFILALQENLSGDERDAKIVVSHKDGLLTGETFHIRQDWLLYTPQGDYVTFSDKAFKAACLETADIDGDRQVSFAEAAAVKELYLPGKGITDLTGLEMFMNLEFFEAQDNDIRNADMLAELHFLHWLDLKGNRNLESFDVSGCSVYFERCWYEVTPQLRYKTFLRQLNITYDCDMYCAHGDVDFDHRVSTDYSRQGELVQWHKHTVGDGKKVLVFTGLGYLDVDHQDGSFDRVMKDALKLYLEACPKLEEHFEEFDVYMMRHIMRTRDEYVFPGSMWNSDEVRPIKKAYSQERTYILKESYNKVSLPGENKLVLTFSIDIHPNVRVVPAIGTILVLHNWDKNYNNEYQMLNQRNPITTLDIERLHEYSFRNQRLETVIVDVVKCNNGDDQAIYNFFGIQ